MKKIIVAVVCAVGLGLIAYASLKKDRSTKQKTEKECEKDEMKEECEKKCMYS